MMELLCALPVIAGLVTGCAPQPTLAAGYVEGEYVLVAPVETVRIEDLHVDRGDRVDAGDLLVALERRDAEVALAETRAALAHAESQLADLKLGRRPEEIAVLQAALASASARATEAERVVRRQSDLLDRGIAPQSTFDDAITARDIAEAAVAEAEANLTVAELPARPDQIAAAEAALEQARAGLENAQWRMDQRTLVAPATGTVSDIIRNRGELAGPQAPVLSMLPDGAVKLRVYVPEAALSAIAPGTPLRVRCEGCGDGMSATVTYVADEPEFTPPVIYSLESRQKLVWLVEAEPGPDAPALKPGQIVDAELPQSSGAERQE